MDNITNKIPFAKDSHAKVESNIEYINTKLIRRI